MSNIRRNQPCPCGSGKKYKKCHGAFASGDSESLPPGTGVILEQKIKELNALRLRRQQQQGLGRPIVAAKLNDQQLVVIGNRTHYSANWRTFHDFLRDFFFGRLGKNWVEAERAKEPRHRHWIMQWLDQAIEATQRSGTKYGEVVSAPMTGAVRAFINLAYNVYLIAHHTPGDHDPIVDRYVRRLKSVRADNFFGALFETYAAAAFLKAGFTLEYENEGDGLTSHVEFIGRYPSTGRKFSVEVKSRERSMGASIGAGTDVDDVKRLRVANKLNKALGKRADHTRVVLIEINVPEVVTSPEGWPMAAMKQIRDNEKTDFPSGEKKPAAYVFITNHAFHNNLGGVGVGMQVLAAGFHIPDFGPDAWHVSYKCVLEARERHVEMFALLQSMRTHYEIPSTFDGEIPELAFQEPGAVPPLKFGRWYLVPNQHGEEVPGCLCEASVLESTKEVFGIYRLATGEHITATCPISDAELVAYRKYPETFFGEVRQAQRSSNTLVELCDFFYETYKDTPREKLLEWLADAPDIEHLKTLSQKDLAIIICERWAVHGFNQARQKQAS